MCPLGGRWIDGGDGPVLAKATLVCHCLVVETRAGVVLVDTGLFAKADFESLRIDVLSREGLGTEVRRDELASTRVEQLGFAIRDVTHLVPTHLDLDHAGGIADFPHATTHVMAREHDAASMPKGFFEHSRYVRRHFEGARFARHEVDGERWKGFDAVRPIPGTADEVLMIPLYGHTRGHAAVAVSTDQGWIVHCGDAYFSKREVAERVDAPPLLEFFQRTVAFDDELRRANRDRLRALRDEPDVKLFCAHSPEELDDFRTSRG